MRNVYKTTTKDSIKKNKDVLDIMGTDAYFNDIRNRRNDNMHLDAFIKRLNPVVMKYRNQFIDAGKSKAPGPAWHGRYRADDT